MISVLLRDMFIELLKQCIKNNITGKITVIEESKILAIQKCLKKLMVPKELKVKIPNVGDIFYNTELGESNFVMYNEVKE